MPTPADDARRQLPRIAVTAAVVVLAGLAVTDWYIRNIELHNVVLTAEDADDAIDHWHTARREIAASLPSAHYLTDEHRRRGERLIRREATASARSLTGTTAGMETITVRLPWHHGIIRARNRYREHVSAWIARLRGLARDPARLDESPPTIAATRAASEEAFRAALPPAALYDLDERISALFAR